MNNFICQESIEKVISIILRLPGLFLLDFYYTIATTNENGTEDPPGISGFVQILGKISVFYFFEQFKNDVISRSYLNIVITFVKCHVNQPTLRS